MDASGATNEEVVRLLEEHVALEESMERSLRQAHAACASLTAAAEATVLFHTTGGLVSLQTMARWSTLTGGHPMTAQGLLDFVRAKIAEAT